MKLFFVLTAILALSLAEQDQQEIKGTEKIEDSESGVIKIEPLKKGAGLKRAAYIPPSQRDRRYWETHQSIQAATWAPQVQNDYSWVSSNAPQEVGTSTTPIAVYKNDFYIGDNGDYKYEYQIADGTHVGEQGYFTNPNQNEETLVKKGWYSFVGSNGVTYKVVYWADHTGYHAQGSHIPGSIPESEVKPSQQGYYENPSQAQAPATQRPVYTTTYPGYNPPQPTYNPPQQTYDPPKPTYNPPQQTYYPPEQTYNPTKPIYNPPQQTYNPPQSTYNPPQQTYKPSQETYNPSQSSYSPPQQTYNPTQQNYNPPQSTYNPSQQSYNPSQQTYNPTQQSTYNPPQQTYNPPQQNYNPSQETYTPLQSSYTQKPQQSAFNQQQGSTYYGNQKQYYKF